jgi:hypothetical protein
MKKNIEAKKLNLAALRKRKMQLDGTDKRIFLKKSILANSEYPIYRKRGSGPQLVRRKWSVHEITSIRIIFWMNASMSTDPKAKNNSGMYSSLVTLLLSELGMIFRLFLVLSANRKPVISKRWA